MKATTKNRIKNNKLIVLNMLKSNCRNIIKLINSVDLPMDDLISEIRISNQNFCEFFINLEYLVEEERIASLTNEEFLDDFLK